MIPKATQRKALLAALTEVEDTSNVEAVREVYERKLAALVGRSGHPANRAQRRAWLRAASRKRQR